MLKRLIHPFLLLLILSMALPAHAGDPDKYAHKFGQKTLQPTSGVRFVQNKGQWEPQVRLAADVGHGGRVFVEDGRLRFAFCNTSELHEQWFHRKEENAEIILDCHSYSITFEGANPAAEIIPLQKATDYNNYFVGNDPQHWATDVPLFESVMYENIYPGIDYVLHGAGESIKYDFILHPGADPSLIRMRFEGQDGLKLDGLGLTVLTTVIQVQDSSPVAFQDGREVSCVFTRKGDVIGFEMPAGYDPAMPLLIDPTMVFSTYSGSSADNFGFTATYSDNGDLYAGGIAYGGGYPVTNGAYQVSFGGGGFDASISKFGPTGAHLYSTYIGGSGNDQPHSMVVDPNSDLLIMGRTFSSNFPTSSGCFDPSYNGNADIFVFKLSKTGNVMLGSTFVGGSGDDALNITTAYQQGSLKHNYGDDARGEVVVDATGNVYVANCTRSGNFPVTAGAMQSSLGGVQDGCVFKLNPNLSTMVWSTFLGGSAEDAAYSLKVDGNSNVVVAGGTDSQDFPATVGSYDPSYNGAIDGYIARINNVGTAMLSATFIGNGNYNQCYFVEMDADEDVYVVGQKVGTWPVTAGTWTTGQGGQFIMKLSKQLNSLIYSTQFGNSNATPNISPTAFLVDVCEYVYVAGWGGSTNFGGFTSGLPTTPGAFQSSTDGSDLYVIVLTKDAAAIDYATFVGGPTSNEHVDGGTSRFNKNAEIYHSVCAGCWGNSDFPTTSNAWSNTNNSSGCNLACFKMQLTLPGIRAQFYANPIASGCAPLLVTFTNISLGGVSYNWNFADPTSGPLNTSTLVSPTHVFNQPGTYTVMLVAMDPNSCNLVDTSYTTINVYPPLNIALSPDSSICQGESIQLQASGGQIFSWSPPTGLSSTNSSSPTASPTTTTTYQVIVAMASGCRDTGEVTVEVLPSPTAAATGATMICPGDSAQLSASGGVSYLWTPASTLSTPSTSTTWAHPSVTTPYVVTVTAANGCEDTETVVVEVSIVNAQAGADIDLCIGDDVQLNASGGGTYAWSPGSTLSSTTIPNPIANPTLTTTYHLVVTNNVGCQDEDSVTVTLHPLPIVSAGPDLIMCQQDSIQLTAAGALTYTWSPATVLSNPNTANPFAFPTQSTTFFLLGTDQWGCQNRDTLDVDVLGAPLAVATGPQLVCQDSTAQLSGAGGITYEWYPSNLFNNHLIQNPIATLESTIDVVLRVIGTNGCDDRDTLRIAVTPTPVVDANADRLVCIGQVASLYATGANSVLWSTGDTSRRVLVYPDTSTTYYVTGFVDDCPSLPDSVRVTIDTNLPIADFHAYPDSGIVPLTPIFNNMSQGAVSYAWQFGDGYTDNSFEPAHTYQDTGRFEARLIAYNSNGCADTMVQKIIVGVDFTIYVPTAFTPNDDDLNDYFNTPWIGVRDFHIMIFDRWGMLIYESFDPNFKWYGVFKGDPCQEGVYTYVLDASGYLGYKVKRAGTVTLYR